MEQMCQLTQGSDEMIHIPPCRGEHTHTHCTNTLKVDTLSTKTLTQGHQQGLLVHFPLPSNTDGQTA